MRYTPSPSAVSGETVEGYTDGASVWASIEPLSGRELLNAQQITGESTHRVRMRFTDAITRKDRIRFQGTYPSGAPFTRYFEVESLNDFAERNFDLTLVCHEIT